MKRFYRAAECGETEGGWQVRLDGRGVKTAGGRAQVVPSRALAVALAAEWAAQGEEIDPAGFVLRDLADYVLDVVTHDPAALVTTLTGYAETDTLCYRADPEEPLHARQLELWEPLLRAAELRWDVHFERIAGVIHRPQPEVTLARMRTLLTTLDPYTLAALHNTASLAASLVIGLAALEPAANVAGLWQAAELEETWQAEQWGEDAEAALRRARRFAGFTAATRFAALAREQ
jgi:chaperone required for assembly of F1-ATPase